MIRTQVQLDEAQYDRLKVLATRESKSISQIVRESLDQFLIAAERRDRWQRLWDAVGSCHDPEAAPDVATRHDDYLTQVYRG